MRVSRDASGKPETTMRRRATWTLDEVDRGLSENWFRERFSRYPYNALVRINGTFELVKGERLVGGKYKRVKRGEHIDRLKVDRQGLNRPILL